MGVRIFLIGRIIAEIFDFENLRNPLFVNGGGSGVVGIPSRYPVWGNNFFTIFSKNRIKNAIGRTVFEIFPFFISGIRSGSGTSQNVTRQKTH